MFIIRYIRNIIILIILVLGAIYTYDMYHSFQGTNRESKAHTSIEQQIEQNEDTLSNKSLTTTGTSRTVGKI